MDVIWLLAFCAFDPFFFTTLCRLFPDFGAHLAYSFCQLCAERFFVVVVREHLEDMKETHPGDVTRGESFLIKFRCSFLLMFLRL